jgi:pimeloyl-ACP methyl ester carboxylesterase
VQLHRLEAGGAALAVREWPGRGTPLLAWHALGQATSGAFLDVFAGRLAEHGLRPLALDAPGFGRSPALPVEGYAVDDLARLVFETADALALERPILLGHSWGAVVVLEAARRDPGRFAGIVLMDAGHADYADWPTATPNATLEEMIQRSAGEDEVAASWDDLAAEVAAEYPGRDWLMDFYREGARTTPAGRVLATASAEVRGAARHGLLHAHPSAAWPVLAAAGVPGLLLLATVPEETDENNRRFAPAFAAAWPTAEIVHVEGGTHSLFTELGAELGELIGGWAERRGIA